MMFLILWIFEVFCVTVDDLFKTKMPEQVIIIAPIIVNTSGISS